MKEFKWHTSFCVLSSWLLLTYRHLQTHGNGSKVTGETLRERMQNFCEKYVEVHLKIFSFLNLQWLTLLLGYKAVEIVKPKLIVLKFI